MANIVSIPRADLLKAFRDLRIVLAWEALQAAATEVPDVDLSQVEFAQATADSAVSFASTLSAQIGDVLQELQLQPPNVTLGDVLGLSANPTAQVGLIAINGVASTFMRSDAAPSLSQAIAPTWTGNHVFAPTTGNTVVTNGNFGVGTSSPSSKFAVATGDKYFEVNPTGVGGNPVAAAIDRNTSLYIPMNYRANTYTWLSSAAATIMAMSDAGVLTAATWQGNTVQPTFGGTGQATYTLGDILYSNTANGLAKLAGNTTTTRQFLRQVGNGTVSAAPVWDTLTAADIPSLSGTYQPLDADLTAIAALSTTGILARTASSTWALRTITAGTAISVSNGDGVSGNPTINNTGVTSATGTTNQVNVSGSTGAVTFSLPQNIHTTATPQFARVGTGVSPTVPWHSVNSQGRFARWDASTALTFLVDIDDSTPTYTGSARTVTLGAARLDAGTIPKLRLAAQGGLEFAVDANTVRGFLSPTTGRFSVQIGAVTYAESAGNAALLGGTTYQNTTTTGNVAATETDAFSHTIAANTLAVTNGTIEFEAAGTFAATGSLDKRVKVVFGSTTIFDSGALAITSASSWTIRGAIMRTSSTTQKCTVTLATSSSIVMGTSVYTAASENLATGLTLKLTVNGTNANDTVAQMFREKYFPGW